MAREFNKDFVVTLAKWKDHTVLIRILVVAGNNFQEIHGQADEIFAREPGDRKEFFVRDNCEAYRSSFFSYYRHCIRNLRYKKIGYYSQEQGVERLPRIAFHIHDEIERVCAIMFQGSKDLVYQEPGWWNNS